MKTVLRADGSGVDCQTMHLTTFGGLISIPTTAEELLAELADAFKFNTFTMDEAFALLANFNIGDNMTIFLIITIIIGADFLSIAWLGYYRGRRYRMRRRREGAEYEAEAQEYELHEYNKKLRDARLKFTRARVAEEESSKVADQATTQGRWQVAAAKAVAAPRQLKRMATNANLGIKSGQRRLSLRGFGTSMRSFSIRGDPSRSTNTNTRLPALTDRRAATPPAPAPSPPRLRMDTPTPPRPLGGTRHASATVAPAPPETIAEHPIIVSGSRVDSPRRARVQSPRGDVEPSPPASPPDLVESPRDGPPEAKLTERQLARRERDQKLQAMRESRKKAEEEAAAAAAAQEAAQKKEDEEDEKKGEEGEEEETRIVLPPNPTLLDRTKYMARRSMVELKGFGERLGPTLRSEHTFVNLVAPPDDEESLQQAQVVQLFWNTIALELFLTCLQAQVEDESGLGASDWGAKRVDPKTLNQVSESNRKKSLNIEDENALSLDTFSISPVTALTQGVISSMGTMGFILFCAYVFTASNSRQRKGMGILKQIRYVRRKLGKCRRACERWYKRHNFDDDDDDEIPDTPPSEEEEPPEGMAYVNETYLTQIGWVVLVAGCIACPGCNLLALYFCKRKRRVLIAVEDAPPSAVQLTEMQPKIKAAKRAATVANFDDEAKAAVARAMAEAEAEAEAEAAEEAAAAANSQKAAPLPLTMAPGAAGRGDEGGGALAPGPDGASTQLVQSRIKLEKRPGSAGGLAGLGGARGEREVTLGDGQLGINLEEGSDGAVRVADVTSGSPGEAQGVKTGDTVLAVNGKPTAGLDKPAVVALIKAAERPLTLKLGGSGGLTGGISAEEVAPGSKVTTEGSVQSRLPLLPQGSRGSLPTSTPPPSPPAGDLAERQAMAREINARRRRGDISSASEVDDLVQMRQLQARKKRMEGIGKAGKNLARRASSATTTVVNKGLKVGEKERDIDFASVVLEAQIKAKMKALRWRGPIEYNIRQAIGWLINLLILSMCLFISLIYAAKFGNNQFTSVAVSWLMAYAWTFILVEPFQVIFLAGAPCLFNEETRCGRCMLWCRFIYNELVRGRALESTDPARKPTAWPMCSLVFSDARAHAWRCVCLLPSSPTRLLSLSLSLSPSLSPSPSPSLPLPLSLSLSADPRVAGSMLPFVPCSALHKSCTSTAHRRTLRCWRVHRQAHRVWVCVDRVGVGGRALRYFSRTSQSARRFNHRAVFARVCVGRCVGMGGGYRLGLDPWVGRFTCPCVETGMS